MLSIEKYSSELEKLVGAPPRHVEGRELSEEHNLLQKAAAAARQPPRYKERLARKLRAAVEKQVGQLALPRPPAEQPRKRACPDWLQPEDFSVRKPVTLDWELAVASLPTEAVEIAGEPVHLEYEQRRSPSGFRDALSFLRQLGDGSRCIFKRRRKSLLEQPQEIQILASRRPGSRAANPLTQQWRKVTEDPSIACTEGTYVKVYYGGEAAARLQERARARLPANLSLRGHRRSLMLFVSASESNSTTHFDETPSVLVCLCGTRTVWLAPFEVAERCGLRHRAGYRHLLSFDPSAAKKPHPAWKCVVLHEGQGVFIPKRWWHLVRASEGSIGMSLEVTDV
jgi:hypothetical protein